MSEAWGFLTEAKLKNQTAAWAGSLKTVLVIDDDDMVRSFAARSLEKRGYFVLQAPDHRAAIRLASNTRALDLVVCDIVLPDACGAEVWQAVSLICPYARVLFVSGYSKEELVTRELLTTHTRFLGKPFTGARLFEAVRAVLEYDAGSHASVEGMA